MASTWSNAALADIQSGALDLDTDTLKIMLLTSAYTPNPDHDTVDDIVANECSVSGYTGGFNGAGRKTLASKTVTKDDTNNRGVFDAADPSQYTLGAGNTLRYATVIKEITNDAGSRVVCTLDFGADKVTNGGTFDLAFNASGIAYLQA